MVGCLTQVLGALRAPFSVLLPFLGRARRSTMLFRIVLWTLHVLLVLAILFFLHWLNVALKLGLWIPLKNELLTNNWLPILFLLVYVLCWLGWWLWRLLVSGGDFAEFPDIAEAWDEAMHALAVARLDPREAPLFLIVGRPRAPMAHLFQAANLQLIVKPTPAHADAPLQVCATRDAVYVSCPGASLLGRHAAWMVGEGAEAMAYAPPTDDPAGTLAMTNQPGRAPGKIPEIAAIIAQAGRERRDLTDEEKHKINVLERQDRTRPAVVRTAAEVELQSARFEHLCRLILRDRAPFCPVNGMLVLMPFAGTDTDQDALDAGSACQNDLAVARRVLQVNCPTLAMVCDLEGAPGFTEFVERFPQKQRAQRVGQRCPLVPALEARNGRTDLTQALEEMLESLALWICGAVTPGFVYKYFRLEAGEPQTFHGVSRTEGSAEVTGSKTALTRSPGGRSDVVRGNAQLFRFMHQLRERQRRLGRLLANGVVLPGEEPILFGGCYIAGTGADPTRQQAFVAGVFHRLTGEENYVSWTNQARAEEASYQHWVFVGQICLGVLVVAVVALAFWTFWPVK
jgi:hypothetical protein